MKTDCIILTSTNKTIGIKKMSNLETVINNIVNNDVITNCSYMVSELSGTDNYIDEIMEFSTKYADNDDAIAELEEDIEELNEYKDDLIEELSYEETNDEYIKTNQKEVDIFSTNWVTGLEKIIEKDIQVIQWEIEELQNAMDYPTEALEFWIVTNWLADQLEEQDELITHDFMGFSIWGRTTSGQHISLDYVIQKIAKKVMI